MPNESPQKRSLALSHASMASPKEMEQTIHRLTYELENLKTENQLLVTNAEATEYDCENRIKAMVGEKTALEASQNVLFDKHQALAAQVVRLKDDLAGLHARLTEETLNLRFEVQALQEENENVVRTKQDTETRLKRQANELSSTLTSLREVNELLETELLLKVEEIRRLKLELAGVQLVVAPVPIVTDTTDFLEKELSQQLETIKQFEAQTKQQQEHVKALTTTVQSLSLVKEENRSLEAKLQTDRDLEGRLHELELQRLELQKQLAGYGASVGDGLLTEYTKVRNENLVLNDQILQLRSELKLHDNEVDQIMGRFTELETLVDELTAKNAKLDRQKVLSLKEIESLRKQLKEIDEFDTTEHKLLHPSLSGPAYKVQLQLTLEDIEQIRSESERVRSEAISGQKRPRTDSPVNRSRAEKLEVRNLALENEKIQFLSRNKVLQDEVERLRKQLALATEIQSHKQQRVLELKSNPTRNHQMVKQTLLDTLTRENNQLLAKLQNQNKENPGVDHVPRAVYDRKILEQTQLEQQVSDLEKRQVRLKEVFSKKSLEFVNTISEILGYKLEFLSSSKVKVYSKYNAQQYLTIDPYKKTLKIGSNDEADFETEDEFERRCNGLIKYWVGEKGEIPCFLAALSLELFEKRVS
ncbi:hypothetical protein BABINDRAFT_10261 [Babjeviella inositovora NRRL Y-12698]|uniref:Spindle assembly checkpoint component MAD1 n=1 Tax=Babjeviella inositovora NRRL Y-12698 TaxID=984486 RepID=A0A1E3QIT8_9ASCO|nr:uncharacterized protein BABINDRAFT_10261 [Babjeviella inositovora NRRL Y-12698]ODQ77364.1 hypothetical protein BABINDRAFT_10261 [Babjeviella inositovora NRRL Y-12698]